MLKLFVFACILFACANLSAATHTYYDFREPQQTEELQNMESFHLQQAETKLNNNQDAYAWGDYAYLLCHIPNHHVALKKMSELAMQLNKHAEMIQFFEQAVAAFPDDQKTSELFAEFRSRIIVENTVTTQP